jgi:hypothetical protein
MIVAVAVVESVARAPAPGTEFLLAVRKNTRQFSVPTTGIRTLRLFCGYGFTPSDTPGGEGRAMRVSPAESSVC